ncbi:acetylxylan esterase [Pseudonocardia xishanensis]|uniref:Acetylxylan esterase n=1 Tax=Pseudonocardia xishanensis TaxID=630995 RepID=A0ABP8RVZ0_9PSEU
MALCAGGGVALQGQALAAPAPETVAIDGVDYPNPLRRDDGGAVTTVADWEGVRRAELLEAFQENVYGRSLPAPTAQTFGVAQSEVGGVRRKIVTITLTGPRGTRRIEVPLFLPAARPAGTFLMIDHRGAVDEDPARSSDYAPVSTIVKAGYAFVALRTDDLAPDGGDYRDGVIDLFHPAGEELPADAGRAISAWAWGASRVMDYLETDPDVDAAKVAVLGHSRSGKAALWAGAQDTRFAAAVANDAGSTGTALARRSGGGEGGESVAQLTRAFPHWFPPVYRAYGDRVDELPVDQHQLLALMAPRRVVVGSATEDANADPEGEFLAYRAAAPVYALYGLGDTGLASTAWPPAADQGFRGPAMSYHLRSGGHGLTAADWTNYLDGDLFAAVGAAPVQG